jgi:hypothetical protein
MYPDDAYKQRTLVQVLQAEKQISLDKAMFTQQNRLDLQGPPSLWRKKFLQAEQYGHLFLLTWLTLS